MELKVSIDYNNYNKVNLIKPKGSKAKMSIKQDKSKVKMKISRPEIPQAKKVAKFL